MRGYRLAVAAGLVLAIAAIALPSSASAARLAVFDSLRTVKPGSDPSGATQASIAAARNEFESFQIAISARDAPLSQVDISLGSPLTGSRGTIPARNVTIYREAYLDIKHPSDLEGGRGRWPDALIPRVDPFYGERRNAFPVNIPQGENRVAWVDVLVPPNQPAGDYSGRIRITAGSGFSRIVPVDLHVYPFGIPSTSTLQSAFGIDWEVCTAHSRQRLHPERGAGLGAQVPLRAGRSRGSGHALLSGVPAARPGRRVGMVSPVRVAPHPGEDSSKRRRQLAADAAPGRAPDLGSGGRPPVPRRLEARGEGRRIHLARLPLRLRRAEHRRRHLALLQAPGANRAPGLARAGRADHVHDPECEPLRRHRTDRHPGPDRQRDGRQGRDREPVPGESARQVQLLPLPAGQPSLALHLVRESRVLRGSRRRPLLARLALVRGRPAGLRAPRDGIRLLRVRRPG